MLYSVSNDLTGIDFAPSTEIESILQNCRMILSTVKNSVPLFREFGIDSSNLDNPISEITKAKIAAEIIQQIQQYEPRCKVKRCEITGNIDGELQIVAQIEL